MSEQILPKLAPITRRIPEWFIAIFAIVYLSGYLADFFFYSSIGIPEVGSDILKLKYVQTGIFFYLIFICTGGVAYLLRVLRSNESSLSFQGRSRLTYLVAITFQPSVILAVAFVPPSVFQEPIIRIVFGLFIFLNVIFYMWLVKRVEHKHAGEVRKFSGYLTKAEHSKKITKYSSYIAIVMLAVIATADVAIFEKPVISYCLALWHDPLREWSKPIGPMLFLIFSVSFFQTLGRLVSRAPNLTWDRSDIEYAFSMGFLLLGMFYLSLTAYAYTILPFIPFERGGANFCGAPIVSVVQHEIDIGDKTNRVFSRAKRLSGVVVYATSDTLYIARATNLEDSCHWKRRPDFPEIYGVPKSDSDLTISP